MGLVTPEKRWEYSGTRQKFKYVHMHMCVCIQFYFILALRAYMYKERDRKCDLFSWNLADTVKPDVTKLKIAITSSHAPSPSSISYTTGKKKNFSRRMTSKGCVCVCVNALCKIYCQTCVKSFHALSAVVCVRALCDYEKIGRGSHNLVTMQVKNIVA